jgi:sulfur carrier protein ThiS
MTEARDLAPALRPATMRIRLKLFAMLSGYLPAAAARNEIELDVPAGSTPASVIAAHHLPPRLCALVILNGVFVRVDERATRELVDGDVLAIWPPVAGG